MSKTYLHLDDRHQYTLRDKETHEVVKGTNFNIRTYEKTWFIC